MILPFLLALMAFCALLPILAPLLRGGRPVASRGSFDQAVYRDQLHELDRDEYLPMKRDEVRRQAAGH